MSVHNVQMSSTDETTWPCIVKLHIEYLLEGGTKAYFKWSRSMTKMAAISIYGKNLYKASSPKQGVYDLKIGIQHWGLKFYKSGINDDLC